MAALTLSALAVDRGGGEPRRRCDVGVLPYTSGTDGGEKGENDASLPVSTRGPVDDDFGMGDAATGIDVTSSPTSSWLLLLALPWLW